MTVASSLNSSEPNPLDPIIAAYLEAVERGDKPDRDRLMLDHPQLASELRAFFADLDRVHQAAGKPADYDATVIGMKEPTPGTILGGRYKLLENIGEGGMGSVWVAEQQQPVKRKVAIKLVKAGMDSKQVLARFEAERQALAVMDHPNIAKVFDGGMTDQGRPYFVMEYVKGIPFTEYCDRVKLSLKERLILFIPVCHAVQHAHHKGIVHRDLKPSNILICLYDGKPVPKVIDFGLAKAMHQPLTEKSIHTGHGIMVGTPVYMSPEQAEHNNLDVDTRTDIYSLGVVLYELLVGTTPLERQQLQQAAFDEILRLIKEVEPPRPSVRLSGPYVARHSVVGKHSEEEQNPPRSVGQQSSSLELIARNRSTEPGKLSLLVRGDLDWIVMKSLEKERTRRYETANGFAQDIERFLNEEPVEACPPSRSYLLKKFLKKHRGQVIAVGMIAAALVLGLSGMYLGFRSAQRSARETIVANKKLADENEAKEHARKNAIEEKQRAERNFIDGLLRPIGHGEELNEAELRSFVDWAAIPSEDSLLKLRVLEIAFDDPATAMRLARRAERAIQSCVGLSASRRVAAIQLLTTKQKDQKADPYVRVAACWLAMELGNAEFPALTESIDWLCKPDPDEDSTRPELAEYINILTERIEFLSDEQITRSWDALMAGLSESSYLVDRETTGRFLVALASKLSDEQITNGWDALIAGLGKNKNWDFQEAAGNALSVLAPKLSDEQITHGWDTLITGLGKNESWHAQQAVGNALVVLAPKLSNEQITHGWDTLITGLGKNESWHAQYAISNVLVALAPKLSDEQITSGWESLITLLGKNEHWVLQEGVGNALVALAPKLSDEQITRGADTLIDVLGKAENGDVLSAGNALVSLAPKLSDEQIKRGADALIDVLGKNENWHALHAAGNALVALAPKLSDEQIARGADALIAGLGKNENRHVQRAAISVFVVLAPKLDEYQITRGWDALIDVLGKNEDGDVLEAAGTAIVTLAPKLSDEQISRGWDALVDILGKNKNWGVKEAAGNALVTLAPKLSDEQITRGWYALIDVLEKNEDSYTLQGAGNALVTLAPKLNDEQITRRSDALIAVLAKNEHWVIQKVVSNALLALAPKLSDAQTTRVWEVLIGILGKTRNHFALKATSNALVAFAPKLSDEQITRVWEALIDILGKTKDENAFDATGTALLALAPRLSDEQTRRGRELLLKIVEKGDAGQSAAVETVLVLPPYMDAETRTRIVKVLENDFRCEFALQNLPKVAPKLDPPNGTTLSQKMLSQLMNDESTAVESYNSSRDGSPIETVTMAIPEAQHIVKMLAHPGAVGEVRQTLLKRFEELVLYDGQHIFLTLEPEEEVSDTTVNAELGGLTLGHSPEESPRNTPEPPPRKFRTIYDVQVWIQQNWPEFNLDETPEVEWPRWR